MSSFARGKYAFGYCDKTGFRYPLKDLVPEIVNQRPTGFLVGKDAVDPDQPQLQLGKLKVDDPKSLRDPRPDRSMDESFLPLRNFFLMVSTFATIVLPPLLAYSLFTFPGYLSLFWLFCKLGSLL